jgi:hypothetical protein
MHLACAAGWRFRNEEMAKAAKIGFSVAGAGFHPAAKPNSHFGSAIVTLDIGDSHFDL